MAYLLRAGKDFLVLCIILQEYFVALHLLRKTTEEQIQFAVNYHNIPIWREPLLLTIAYKSSQDGHIARQETNDLIQAIADSRNDCEDILHNSLLFAVSSIVDCSIWSVDKKLQQNIANRLYDLYGDALITGRYSKLQRGIENAAVLWLQGQPQESRHTNTKFPLLEAWHKALVDTDFPVRQEGAARLLSTVTLELPISIIQTLIPALIQLTNSSDFLFSSNEDIQPSLPTNSVLPRTEYYAWKTLCELNLGPFARLPITWNEYELKQQDFMEKLRQFANELGITLKNIYPSQWYILLKIGQYQVREVFQEQHWRGLWDTFLQEEMKTGRYATYQLCLGLRLLLCEENKNQRQVVANQLMEALLTHDRQQLQALITITNVYLQRLKSQNPTEVKNLGQLVQYPRRTTQLPKEEDFLHTFGSN